MVKIVLFLAILLICTAADQFQKSGDSPLIQKPNKNPSFKPIDIVGTFNAIENNTNLTSSTDFYSLGTYVFNLQQYFNYCEKCQRLQYLAFRVGKYYLTAKDTYLQLEQSSSPSDNQLFIAEQTVDGSWGFKSLTKNKYIRAANDSTTINFQTFLGPWERFYMERHGDHVHIQSAQFSHNWWVFDHLKLEQMNGGASALKVEYWPKLQWLWNW